MRSRRQGSCGQAAVEFAMGALVLMLLVLGIFDFGRAVAAYSAISHGAREGARVALYSVSTDADVRAAVKAQTGMVPDLADDQITISPSGTRSIGQTVKVQVDYTFRAVTPLINGLLPSGGLPLSAAATNIVQ